MPAAAVGSSWAAGSWTDTCWEAGAWADAAAVTVLPDNIIDATVGYTEIKRRIGYTDTLRTQTVTHARRTVTFDG